MLLWTAFVVGLFGSLHCVGMCGPIAMALPVYYDNPSRLVFSRLLYNIGRTITYGFIGAIIGLFGEGLSLAGAQQWLSIFSGIMLILIILIPSRISSSIQLLKPAYHFSDYLKKKFSKFLGNKNLSSVFAIGLLNGFLPCGLVYVALAGSLASGSILNGMLYMIFFGLGTLPLMFVFSLFGQIVGINIRRRFTRLIPVLVVSLGILFILRGLNLGIPYVSPKLKTETSQSVQIDDNMNCH